MVTKNTFRGRVLNFVIRQSEFNGRYQQETAPEDVLGSVSEHQHFIAYLDSSVGIATAYGLDDLDSIPSSAASSADFPVYLHVILLA
jgi:hypothetical protein